MPASNLTPLDPSNEQDLLELAREILSRMTPDERADTTIESGRLGISEEYVILHALAHLAGDAEVGVAGTA